MVPPLGSRRDGSHPPARRAAYRSRSLWLDQASDPLTPRPGLDGDTEADVVVVGGGLTGLWTAYYLAERDPSLSILVIESEIAGFGASGRNGGWCSALLPTSAEAIAADHGERAARAMRAAMRATVTEVGEVAAREGIDCDFAPGGTITLARSAPQLARARAEAGAAARWGDDVDLLGADAALEVLRATGVLGASYTRHCARLHPAKLVRGLARVVEARGVRIVEGTRVTEITPGRVRAVRNHAWPGTGAGAQDSADAGAGTDAPLTVHARYVVRATEAWTGELPTSRRAVVPVYSLMIATEPLPTAFWDAVGLARFETFADHRHLIVYGQRTADDRIAFGGRGAPYHWGSAIEPGFDHVPRVFSALRRTLVELFPAARGAETTHAWGGPLGIARDWHASVGLDAATGLAWAGGYVGDGLSTTNLAGRTLADLITGTDSELVRLPWVGHRSPRWEPEPLRWLGINAGLGLAAAADAEERLTRRESRLARTLASLTGH